MMSYCTKCTIDLVNIDVLPFIHRVEIAYAFSVMRTSRVRRQAMIVCESGLHYLILADMVAGKHPISSY